MPPMTSDWIRYDWEVRGDPALYAVDVAYGDGPLAGYETLFYCSIEPVDEAAVCFSSSELRRAARAEGKLAKALAGTIYVGYIQMDALKQHYYYVQDGEAALESAEAIAAHEKKLRILAGTADEPDWLTYFQLLMPDSAKYQTILNAKLIERQHLAGDSLDKVRRISLLMCFHTDLDRQMYNEDARNAGFAIGDPEFHPELELPHVQTIFALSSLDKREVDAMTTKAIRAAAPYGGELLRWTCPRMAKKSPLL